MTNRVTVCQQREASRKAKSVQDCYIYLYFWQYKYIRKPWLPFHGVWFKLLSQPILIMKQGFSWFLHICMSCKMFQAYIYFLLSYFLHKQDKMSSSKSTQTYYPGKQKWRIMKNIAFSIAVRNAESISGLLSLITHCGAYGWNNGNSFYQPLVLGHIFKISGCIWNSDST